MPSRVPAVNEAIRLALHGQRGAARRLALDLGVDEGTVSKWRAGDALPERARWPAIEQSLGMPAGTLAMAAAGSPIDELDDLRRRVVRLEARLDALEARADPPAKVTPLRPARDQPLGRAASGAKDTPPKPAGQKKPRPSPAEQPEDFT